MSVDERIKKMWCTYIFSYEKEEMLPFATTWVDLEGIMLNELSQTEKANTALHHLYVEF